MLPIEYVKAFYQKPEHLSLEEFHSIMNQEFQKTQNDQLERKKQKQLQKEAEDVRKEEQQKKDIEHENKLKQEKEERERKEKEEQQWKEKEAQLQQEEDERKKVEAAERAAQLETKRKQDTERQQATKLAQALSKDLIDIDELQEEDGALKEIKQEKRDATDSNESELRKIYDVNKQDYRIATKNFELNQQIETYLQEVGTLIVHPDVVYALQHIKDLGAMMWKQNQSQSTDNVLSRNLFPEPQEMQCLDTSDTIASQIKQENGSSVLTSPPARSMFPGLKSTHQKHSLKVLVQKNKKDPHL